MNDSASVHVVNATCLVAPVHNDGCGSNFTRP